MYRRGNEFVAFFREDGMIHLCIHERFVLDWQAGIFFERIDWMDERWVRGVGFVYMSCGMVRW